MIDIFADCANPIDATLPLRQTEEINFSKTLPPTLSIIPANFEEFLLKSFLIADVRTVWPNMTWFLTSVTNQITIVTLCFFH